VIVAFQSTLLVVTADLSSRTLSFAM
jgi:hypothetical protein